VRPDLASYDAVVSDLDGTLWIDGTPLPGAVDLLDSFRRRGAQVCLATNASVATSAQLLAELTRAGLAASGDVLVTAADALGAVAKSNKIDGLVLSGDDAGVVMTLTQPFEKKLANGSRKATRPRSFSTLTQKRA